MASQVLDIGAFAERQLALLAAEQAAETAQTALLLSSSSPATLAASGLAITNLVISSRRTGLGGKTVLELEQDSAIAGKQKAELEHGLRVGDICRIAEQPKGSEKKQEKAKLETGGVEGVVIRAKYEGISIAVDEGTKGEERLEVLGNGGRLWVVKLANDIAFRRMNQTMQHMQKMQDSDHTTLMRICFGLETPTPPADISEGLTFFDETLNDSQKDAVRFALTSREVALIHGPPGTGKTYTLIELLRQLIKQNKRILVCGPSNISVDNIVERLAPYKIPILRLGHPARLLPSVLNLSLDILTQTSDAGGLVKDIRKEMDQKQASIKKTRNGRERRAIYLDIKDLRKEYRAREHQCVDTLVQQSKIILATLHGAGGHQLRGQNFDVVIIDEASQALEAQSWIPLLKAKKVVLAGDHLQLAPTVKSLNNHSKRVPTGTSKSTPSSKHAISSSKENATSLSSSAPASTQSRNPEITLETTLFSRLLSLHGPTIKRMLKTQYRMHSLICAFPSISLYNNELVSSPSVASRLLTALPYPVADTDTTREPLIFYDTQGGDFPESSALPPEGGVPPEGGGGKKSIMLADSKSNVAEAMIAARHVRELVEAGVKGEDIAVITPYNAQVALLAGLLKDSHPEVELGSVDGFQGREKEVVVLTLVRSNVDESAGGGGRATGIKDAEVGFLAEKRRLNVGMTRPKRQLVVIADSETVGKGSKFLKEWMAFLEEKAEVRYPDAGEVLGG